MTVNTALVLGLLALVLKFASDTASEIRTIKDDGSGEQRFSFRDFGHVTVLLKALATGAAFAAGVIVLLNL